MARHIWLGRFSVGATNRDFTVDDAGFAAEALAVTAGKYYLDGYTSEGANSLVGAMDAALAASTNYTNISVSFSYTTRKVTIQRDSGSTDFTLTWDDTALRDALGFTANLVSGSADAVTAGYVYTGSNEAKYVWSPARTLSSHPVDQTRLLEPESTTIVHAARDGTLTAVAGTLLSRADVAYGLLAGARVFIPSTGSINQEFESFFQDVIHKGENIRVFPSDAATTSSDYVTVRVMGEGDEGRVGSFSEFARRHVRGYNGLWDVALSLRKVV